MVPVYTPLLGLGYTVPHLFSRCLWKTTYK